jgi:hypothetical protein
VKASLGSQQMLTLRRRGPGGHPRRAHAAHAQERGMSINTAFSRELLKRILDEVRAYRKSTGDRFAFKLTDAWVYRVGTDHWEFHFGVLLARQRRRCV